MELPPIIKTDPLEDQLKAAQAWVGAGKQMADPILVRLGKAAITRILAEQELERSSGR
jgi:hypothetical protein